MSTKYSPVSYTHLLCLEFFRFWNMKPNPLCFFNNRLCQRMLASRFRQLCIRDSVYNAFERHF